MYLGGWYLGGLYPMITVRSVLAGPFRSVLYFVRNAAARCIILIVSGLLAMLKKLQGENR